MYVLSIHIFPKFISIRHDYKWDWYLIGDLYKVILNFYFLFDTGKNIQNLTQIPQDEKTCNKVNCKLSSFTEGLQIQEN